MIYGRKWQEYADQWNRMVINPSRVKEAIVAAEYAIKHKDIYDTIQLATGVPWPMVAINHRRESNSQDSLGNPLFNSYLGNGQSLWVKTTIVPKGRGPFCEKNSSDIPFHKAFVAGAIDAYKIDHIDQVKDWKIEKILFYSESFNGTGYDLRRLPSPYLWGGTNIQKPGKYVRDHVFSARAMDKQLGCAAVLFMIQKLDGVTFERES